MLMNLTMYDLKNLKKSCDYISDLVKELQAVYNPDNTERKLFVSRNDYNESLKLKNQIPQDFYYFRLFDIFVQIVYNKQKKLYSIYIDGFYSKILDKYERSSQSDKSYFISSSFEETLIVFQDIINDVMEVKILRNELF